MVLTLKRPTAEARAQEMGRRAGAALRELGTPTRCPFRRPALVRAWARGYVAGSAPHR